MTYCRAAHPLKTEIYKKGYTLDQFADECGISRWTLNNIFNRKHAKKTRGDTIYCLAKTLNMPYENVEAMCNGI